MPKTKPTIPRNKPLLESRVAFFDPKVFKKLEAKRQSIKPTPGWKPFLEMLIEQGLQNEQPQG